MRSRRLAFVLASVVAATAVSVACSGGSLGDPDSAPTIAPGFTAPPSLDLASLFREIAFDPRFDGVVMREARSAYDQPAPDGGPTAVCSAKSPSSLIVGDVVLGEPCGRAGDTQKCVDALACVVSEKGWFRSPGGRAQGSTIFFVFGKDGVLTSVTTRPELLANLGPIDSLPKALLLFVLEQQRVTLLGTRTVPDGFELQVRGGGACAGGKKYEAILLVTRDGTFKELERNESSEEVPPCAEGRRPAGLVAAPHGGIGRGVADYLAEAAHLEAAAVVAFEQMRDTLRTFGAPEHLVRAADRARRDEIRHARTMSALARSFGKEPQKVRVHVEGVAHGSLEALAIENAVEGCVRETYAVLRAMWQAEHAEDARIRAALSVVAREEARHAELSWDLAAWLDAQLDAAARARVDAARASAIAELRHQLGGEPHSDVVRIAGMPNAAAALRLFDELVARTSVRAAPRAGRTGARRRAPEAPR